MVVGSSSLASSVPEKPVVIRPTEHESHGVATSFCGNCLASLGKTISPNQKSENNLPQPEVDHGAVVSKSREDFLMQGLPVIQVYTRPRCAVMFRQET